MKSKLLTLCFVLLIQNSLLASTKPQKPEEIVKGCEPFNIKAIKNKFINNSYDLNSNKNLPLEKNTKAFLLLHGLGGCPHEVSLIGEYLSNNGYDVIAPRYPGHGSKGKVMSDYGWKDWYSLAEKEYLELKNKYDEVYVLGFSTGGTLTLKLAEKYNINKIVLLSPFMDIAYKWYYILRPETYLTTVGSFIDDWPSEYTLVHLNDKVARNNYVRGDYFSFKATRSALELIKETKKDLDKVKADTLIIHSKGDETTDYRGSKDLYKKLQTKKKFITLTRSNHIIGLDYDKNRVFREIKNFVEN